MAAENPAAYASSYAFSGQHYTPSDTNYYQSTFTGSAQKGTASPLGNSVGIVQNSVRSQSYALNPSHVENQTFSGSQSQPYTASFAGNPKSIHPGSFVESLNPFQSEGHSNCTFVGQNPQSQSFGEAPVSVSVYAGNPYSAKPTFLSHQPYLASKPFLGKPELDENLYEGAFSAIPAPYNNAVPPSYHVAAHPIQLARPNIEGINDEVAMQSRTLFFGRIADTVREDDLRRVCSQYGDVKKVVIYQEKRMAFVEYFDLRHAETAKDGLKGKDLCGKPIEVQYSATKRVDKDGNMGTLYIRPTSGNGSSLSVVDPNPLDSYKHLFGSYGDIRKVSVNRKRDCEKFIEYFDLRDAAKALETLDGHNFNGVVLHICYSQNASRSYNRESVKGRRPFEGSYGPQRTSHTSSARSYANAPYSKSAPHNAGYPPAAYVPIPVAHNDFDPSSTLISYPQSKPIREEVSAAIPTFANTPWRTQEQ